jgi:NAD(P)-dependent dehydrogenase (short-subunit alcohol dehydrogenase family)
VADQLGSLDILVNNAAVAILGPIDGADPDDTALDRQIRVNYTASPRNPRRRARAP